MGAVFGEDRDDLGVPAPDDVSDLGGREAAGELISVPDGGLTGQPSCLLLDGRTGVGEAETGAWAQLEDVEGVAVGRGRQEHG